MKRSQVWLVGWALTVFVAALFLSACGGGSSSSSSTGGGGTSEAEGSEGPINVAFLASAQDGYDHAAQKGIEAALKADGGGEVQYLAAEYDPNKQLQECQDVVTRGEAQVVVAVPVTNQALIPCLPELEEAGIKIGSIDTPIGPDYTSTEIQEEGVTAQVIMPIQDDAKAGVEMVVEACEGKDPCQVGALVGNPEFAYSSERIKFAKEDMAKYPNIEIVAEEIGGLQEPKVSLAATQTMLAAHPDLDVVFSDDDYGIEGAQEAVEEAGKTKQVALIGAGGSKQGVDKVKTGEYFGTVLYLPTHEAQALTEMLIEAAQGEEIANPDRTVAEISPYGTITANQENAKEVEADWSE
jgi:ribose transport system substrate-binding protein